MLEDNKVAKIFLSAIIGETIEELEFSAQERTVNVSKTKEETFTEKINAQSTLTVCRVDFIAKIKTETGFKTVLIELQKAKYSSDLMRFRKYLGVHYQNPENTYDPEQNNPRQIYFIYFLDYGSDLPERPVLKVGYTVEDIYSGEEFPASGEFVSGLHHISWIIQIKQLKERRRNDLEKLLSIFDQNTAVTPNKHLLNVDEENLPEEFQIVIRRLRKAMEDPNKQSEMELEDDYIKDMQISERKIGELKKEVEERDKEIEELKRQLTELMKNPNK
jgi:hypothetical protein